MIGCVRNDGGVWYFKEAKLPADWPALTPVGEVQVKQYPGYREAIIISQTSDANQNTMFRPLFEHIRKNDIAMTAPVDVGYTPDAHDPKMRSMSFLYDIPERGPTGKDGNVTVRDVAPLTVASIGIRGRYNDKTFMRGLTQLRTWLAGQSEYQQAGPPRYLGYNSPFIPRFWKYAEVQMPVRRAGQ